MIIGHNDVRACDARPAGKPTECFYCKQQMGWQHKPGCVILQKSVVIRMTIEVVVDVPRDWGKDNVEFKYNESSWCGSNMIEDLANWHERLEAEGAEVRERTGDTTSSGICLCGNLDVDYLRDATEEDHRELPVLIDPKDLEP